MMTLDLPWPSRDLHPNARVHWAKKARAAKKARIDAAIAARAAGIRKIEAASLNIIATFAPPDKRRRDDDGMLASLKSSLDGIADVIGVDDGNWRLAGVRRADPVRGGNVRVEIEVAND